LTLQNKNTFLYFAYASNLNKQQMRERCSASTPKYSAVLPNYKRIFAGWSRTWHGGVATIKPFRGEKVQGAVYEVTEVGMRQLEKYDVGYTRLNVAVFDEDNVPHQAVTLVMSGQIQEALPSKEYAVVIKQGQRDWAIG
jgi:gamma-glutamylcyclotransferase